MKAKGTFVFLSNGVLSVIVVLLLIIFFTMGSCRSNNILIYKYRPYFKETKEFSSDSFYRLSQKIDYNNPRIIDEEHTYELVLIFRDTNFYRTKCKLDLAIDTQIVVAYYNLSSIWNWQKNYSLYSIDSREKVVSGKIEILKWSRAEIKIKENIKVERWHGEKGYFRGKRTFRR